MKKLRVTIIRQKKKAHDISFDRLENYLTQELGRDPDLPVNISVQYETGEDSFPLDKAFDKKIKDLMQRLGYSLEDSGLGFGQRDLEFYSREPGGISKKAKGGSPC